MKRHALVLVPALLGLTCRAPAAEIHDAAAKGDHEAVSRLVAKDATLAKARDKAGNEPLHHAAMKGHTDTLSALLDAGADVNAKGFDDWTPLHFAAKSGSADACRTLLARGASREALNGVSRSPLQMAQGGAIAAIRDYAPKVPGAADLIAAVEREDIDEVKAQLAAKPETVSAVDDRGRSSLLVAVRKGNTAIAGLLLGAGANVNAKDSGGQSLLAIACNATNPELVALLFEHKITPSRASELDNLLIASSSPVDPNRVEELGRKLAALFPEIEKTNKGNLHERLGLQGVMLRIREAFGMASASPDQCARSAKLMDLLLEHGANPNAIASGDMTALKAAAMNKDSRFVKLLLQRGAKPDLASSTHTALSFATIAARSENIRLLLDAGADPMLPDVPGKSAILTACIVGDAPLLKELLGAVKHRSSIAESPNLLFSAAMYGQHEIVRMLLEAGSSATARVEHNMNALHHSARSRSEECTRMLIAAGSDVNAQDAAGYTPLANAVESHRNEQVALLLAHGAKIELANSEGRTALLLAAGQGYVDTIELLLKAGARRDALDTMGMNALHSAAAQGRPAAVKALLQAGLPLDARTKPRLSTPLMLAAAGATAQSRFQSQTDRKMGGMELTAPNWGTDTEYAAVVNMLLEMGADINLMNAEGMTALHLASLNGQTNSARLLLAKGAKNVASTGQKVTPLHLAANADLVTLLLENGAAMEATLHRSKFTPLLSAAYAGNAGSLQRLLKHGANIHAKAFGRSVTALHLAASMNRVEAARLLLASGMPIDARDSQQLTPLMVAVTEGRQDVAAFLIESGADVNARGAGKLSILQVALAANRQAIAKLLMEYGAKE